LLSLSSWNFGGVDSGAIYLLGIRVNRGDPGGDTTEDSSRIHPHLPELRPRMLSGMESRRTGTDLREIIPKPLS
jgi:hypothetical protein